MHVVDERPGASLSFATSPFSNEQLASSYPCSSNGKESASNAGDQGLILGSERSSGEGNGNPI